LDGSFLLPDRRIRNGDRGLPKAKHRSPGRVMQRRKNVFTYFYKQTEEALADNPAECISTKNLLLAQYRNIVQEKFFYIQKNYRFRRSRELNLLY